MAITFINSTTGSAINGGNVTLTLPTAFVAGDVAYVAVTLGTSKATALAVTSSSGGPYTQVVATITSSRTRFGVFRQTHPLATDLAQAVVTGSAGSTDSTAAVVMCFSDVETSSPEDVTATSTTGNDTAPNSPSITPVSCSDAIITAVGFGLNNALTAPSSFLNAANTGAADTAPARCGMAWITNVSTAAFDPATWTSTGVAAGWCSATIAVRPAVIIGWNKTPGQQSMNIVNEARRVVVRSYK